MSAPSTPVTASDAPLVVRVVQGLERARALDPAVERVKPLAQALVGSGARRDALQGRWLGHAVHPLLTDLPIGFWTSVNVLDLFGGVSARPAARFLLGLGLASAAPAAVTGWAEWAQVSPRDQRVGIVHALSNASAVGLFTASYVARRRGRHRRGVGWGLAGAGAAGLGGFLGGHLTEARKVASRHPAFETDRPLG